MLSGTSALELRNMRLVKLQNDLARSQLHSPVIIKFQPDEAGALGLKILSRNSGLIRVLFESKSIQIPLSILDEGPKNYFTPKEIKLWQVIEVSSDIAIFLIGEQNQQKKILIPTSFLKTIPLKDNTGKPLSLLYGGRKNGRQFARI